MTYEMKPNPHPSCGYTIMSPDEGVSFNVSVRQVARSERGWAVSDQNEQTRAFAEDLAAFVQSYQQRA